jgi:GAF domain-containing protein
MTQREANADLLAEITALRDRVASQGRQIAQDHEHEAATSEILRLISSSPTDVQPVFEAIAAKAQDLCKAKTGTVFTFDGERIHIGAAHSLSAEAVHSLRQTIPMAPSRGGATPRAILSRAIVYIPDIREDPEYGHHALAKAVGYLSALAVPMMHDGKPIGAITVTGAEAGAFSQTQIELLKTFADQAVIAIENVRLFKELETRNRGLTESLDQQTATAEILSVISQSPIDVQPVFDTIVQSAVRLCAARFAAVFRFDGEMLHLGAHNFPPNVLEFLQRQYPMRPGHAQASGRTILSRAVVQIPDLLADPEYQHEWALISGWRSILGVPMLHEGAPIGAILINRAEPGPFPNTQIALLKTFADQAVIAIENVRLFTELQAKNRDLTAALEQQTATADILRVISSSPTDVQPVFETIAENAARLCVSRDAHVFVRHRDLLRQVSHHGSIPITQTLPLVWGTANGRAVLEGRTVHVADMQVESSEFPEGSEIARRLGHRTVLIVPLMRDGAAVGAIAVRRTEVRLFTERQVALLQTFADQAVIAIENVRLFTELQEKNRALTQAHAQVAESLEQQTATSDILRIISSSLTNVQPVFETIARSATILCEADLSHLYRFDGDLIHFAAEHGGTPTETTAVQRAFPQSPSRLSVTARAILTAAIVQVADVSEEPEVADSLRMFRTVLSVPMLRDRRPLGAITVARRVVRPFTDKQIELLQTFADQAVIAIENVRLFKELEVRTQDLTRSVGELRALGEVGQAISSTLDLQTVLSTIVARATHLSGTDAGVIYEYDEERQVFVPRATERLEEDIVRALIATPIRKGEGATGQLADVQEPIQVADVRDRTQAFQAREVLVRAGYRAALAVPLVRDDRLLGGLTVFRKTPGQFPGETVDLLRTFATQSALAIQNARLFREIEDKSRQLEVASQHKSEFLANMSHELRTPLNAIIGFSEVLTDRMFGELNEKQEEYLKDIYASGTHLLSLINEILDLSKIEAGRMELELTDFDLPTAIENALMLVRERAGRRSIALHTNIDNRLGQIQADERKVRQVVLNLLSNAIKFTPEGGRIAVGAVPKDGLVEVSVTDTGIGIAPEDQEKVFEEFRQVGTAAKKVEGTGLGLTLCRKFVELHGGRIWVKSELGAGSMFTFTIPARRGD